MHGRPRKQAKPEDEAESAAKAEKLRALQNQFLSNHHQKIYTKEAVAVSAKLLEINPEAYTAWNYRKLAVQHHLAQPDIDPDAVKSVLDEELKVVESALRQNFKAYGAWHHRKWVLSKGHSSVQRELKLLELLQQADPRNFHAWNYRRFVAALMNRSEEDELGYTQNLIDKNFSNYSAWHNRSVLLSSLMKKRVQGFSEKEEVLIGEYDLVHNAFFTEENDQSGWFYHLWLLSQTVKTDYPTLVSSWPVHGSDLILLTSGALGGHASSPFNTFLSESGTLPIILYFNQGVEDVSSSTVTVACGFNTKDLVWQPLATRNSQTAHVWVTHLRFTDVDLHSTQAYSVDVTVGHSQGIISSTGFHYNQPSQFRFTVHLQPAKTEPVDASRLAKISWGDENFRIYEPCSMKPNLDASLEQLSIIAEHKPAASTWQTKIIEEETELFKNLSDSKIGKLTLARLLTMHDELLSSDKEFHFEEVLKLYCNLMKLDPSHSRYYKDEHSLVLLQKVTSGIESLLSHCYIYRHSTCSSSRGPICLRLNNLSLSRMGSFDKLLWVQMLDLSHNELHSIEGLEALQLLSYLKLSNNKFGSFSALEPLRHLKSLEVLDLSYNEIGAHSIDTTRYLCSSPMSHSVGSEWDSDEVASDGVSEAFYWEAFFVLKGLNLIQMDVVGNAIADEKFRSFLVKILPGLKWLDGERLN